jgi:hypothetical protein
MSDPSKIYDLVARNGAACERPEAWARLRVPADFFQLKDAERLLEILKENFSDADLIEYAVSKQVTGLSQLLIKLKGINGSLTTPTS